MKLFQPAPKNYDGLEKGMDLVTQMPPGGINPFWGFVREMFPGAWQRNIEPEKPANIVAFAAVYACIALRTEDISKLRLKLMRRTASGVMTEVMTGSSFLKLLAKQNRYQTRIQFLVQWMVSKLMHGNAYILKERDGKGNVIALYPLNPFHVKPLVGSDGSVWYQVSADPLAGIADSPTIPASEIIHDRCVTIWHPLVGVSPIYAAAASATQGIRIQANSARFFENQSRPSLHLDLPGTISDPRLVEIKKEVSEGFSGQNIGKVFITTGGAKVEPMTMPADQAQLIEQLRWTVEDVARAFKIPLYKLGGSALPASGLSTLSQDYYSQALQHDIEAIELLLREGIELADDLFVELDLEGLLRMDPQARAETYAKLIGSAVFSPNDARAKEDKEPVDGGDVPFLQQQNWPIDMLAKRGVPPVDAAPPASPPPDGAKILAFKHAASLLRNSG